jgi:hypothetical protein
VNGQEVSSPEILISYSTIKETSLTIIVPYVDLGSEISSTVPVTIFSKADPLRIVILNYSYTSVLPFVESFSPTSGKDTGGEIISVKLKYFPYPSKNLTVTFGNSIIDAKISASSNQVSTLISFKSPSGISVGITEIKVSQQDCTRSCKGSVSFLFHVKDTKGLELAQPLPTSASYQELCNRGTFPSIQIKNADVSRMQQESVIGIISSFRLGTLTTPSLKVSSRDNITFSIWLAYPSSILNVQEMINLTIVVLDDINRSVCLSFDLYDGKKTRLISVTPSIAPVVANIGVSRLDFRSICTLILGNLSPDLSSLSIYVISKDSIIIADIIEYTVVSTCTTSIDCNRTKVVAKLPALLETGLKGLMLNSTNTASLIFDEAIKFSNGCDYTSFCASKLADYRKILSLARVSCELDACFDPAVLPDSLVVSSSPTRGPSQGGTVIEVWIKNLPAFVVDDLFISVGSGTYLTLVSVISAEFNGTLVSNSARVTLLTPLVGNALEGDQTISISAYVGTIKRTAAFTFRYLKFITGNPVIIDYNPKALAVGSSLNSLITISNFQELEKTALGYDVSTVQFTFTDPNGNLKELSVQATSSDSERTSFLASGSKVDIVGIWKVEIVSLIGVQTQLTVLLFTVHAIPLPQVTNWFPAACLFQSRQVVTVTVLYAPMIFSADTDITASIAIVGQPFTNLNILDLTLLSKSCKTRSCSIYSVSLNIPEIDNSDVTIASKIANVSLTFRWYEMDGEIMNSSSMFPLRYDSPSVPQIVFFSPKEQTVGNSIVASMKITNVNCSQLSIGFEAPVKASAPIQTCMILADGSALLSFQYPKYEFVADVPFVVSYGSFKITTELSYTAPPIEISPADGLSEGGYSVNVLVKGWPNASMDSTLARFIDQANGAILNGTITSFAKISQSSFQATVTVPAMNKDGQVSVQVQSTDGLFSSDGLFTYFKRPLITLVSPKRASVDGQTTSIDEMSIALTVTGFPSIKSIQEIQISFSNSDLFIACDGKLCSLVDFRNSIDVVTFIVQVPEFSAGECQITVSYIATWPFQNRSAAVLFEYYVPPPKVRSVLYCRACPPCDYEQACPPCIQGGVCVQDTATPLLSQAAISTTATQVACTESAVTFCQGVVQVEVENMPQVRFAASSGQLNITTAVTCEFGNSGVSFGTVRRIVSQYNRFTTIEIVPPPIYDPQLIMVSVHVYPELSAIPTSVTFPIAYLDFNVGLQCDKGICQGPSSGDAILSINISNTALLQDVAASDQIAVLFDKEPANILSSSINGNHVSLNIQVPRLLNHDSEPGSFAVNLFVVWKSTSSMITSSQYIYWMTPHISEARFSTYGESIIIVFDSPTNEGNPLVNEDNSCSSALRNSSRLGGNPKCVWISNDKLTIYLGSGATIVPGSTLQVINIRSFNEFSDASDPIAAVQLPKFPIRPALSIKAPTTIDPCTPLEIYVPYSSPRPMTFIWSCSNDEGLNAALREVTEGTITFPAGTPSMQTLDKIYSISVYGIDFLGVSSAAVSISILKKSTPVPLLTFSPPTLQIVRSQAAEVKGEAIFSSCRIAKVKLDFKWRQIAGPTIIPAEHLGTLSQLSLPANLMAAGSLYVVALTVAMSDDPSKVSEALYSIQVGTQPLTARITGGGGEVWAGRLLVLDASKSSDLDLDPSAFQGLEFAWTCSVLDIVTGLSSQCISAGGEMLVLPQEPTMSILPGTLAPSLYGMPYRFSVTVRKSGRLSVSASTTVSVVAAPVPVVGLFADVDSSAYNSEGSIVINADSRLVAHATCQSSSPQEPDFVWNFQPTFDADLLSDRGLFPLGLASRSFVMMGTSAGGSRLPGSRYTIMFTCTTDDGSSSIGMVVQVNFPPSGGRCGVCLLGTFPCAKTGKAITDEFRIECNDWADENLPLQYRFGIQSASDVGDTDSETWFAFSADNRVVILLPTGTFNVLAIVRDNLGAQSSIMEDSVIAVGAGRRRGETSVYVNVDQAIENLKDLLKLGAVGRINIIVPLLAMEMDRLDVKTWGVVDSNNAVTVEQRRDTLISTLVQAADLTFLSSSYVCEALAGARQVSASGNLSNLSISLATSYVARLVLASSVDIIDYACADSAATLVGAAILASSRLNFTSDLTVIADLIGQMEPIMLSVFSRASAGLLSGETFELTNPLSSAELRRMQVNQPAEYHSCLHGRSSASCARYGIDVTLPISLIQDLSIADGTVIDIILMVYDRAPFVFPGSKSPLVVLTLAYPNGSALSVSRLNSPIHLKIPTHEAGEVACAYWDEDSVTYSQLGVTTDGGKGDGIRNVTCLTEHLSSFALIPWANGNVPARLSSTIAYLKETAFVSTTSNVVNIITDITSSSKTRTQTKADEATVLPIASTSTVSLSPWQVISGMEALGPLMLLKRMSLGVPPTNSLSFYSLPEPYKQITILVPAGAWPMSRDRRSNASPELTVNIFSLPSSIDGLPGRICGPAVSLEPHNLHLLEPILVSVGCNGTAPVGTFPATFGFNSSNSTWIQTAATGPQNDTVYSTKGPISVVWALLPTLCPLAAFWVPVKQDNLPTGALLTDTFISDLRLGLGLGLGLGLFVLGMLGYVFRESLGLHGLKSALAAVPSFWQQAQSRQAPTILSMETEVVFSNVLSPVAAEASLASALSGTATVAFIHNRTPLLPDGPVDELTPPVETRGGGGS